MSKTMTKIALNKSIRGEKGQALILVLILLLVGGLIIAPLLAFMSTGLTAGRVHEWRMAEVYAADAGIEDGIWKMKHDQVPTNMPYLLAVNGKDVAVTIPSQKDTTLTFFKNLGVLDPQGEGDYNKARPQQEWLMVYAPIATEPGEYSEYRITTYYASDQPRDILSTGFWIYQYFGATSIIPWDETEDGLVDIDINLDGDTLDPGEQGIPTKPLIQDYPNYQFRTADSLGRAFIWEWNIGDGPRFGKGVEGKGKDKVNVYCRTQRFTLTPAVYATKNFPPNCAWAETKQNSIQISWYGGVTGFHNIIAVATEPDTNKSTTVTSYIFAQETPGSPEIIIAILSWEATLQ